MENLSQHSFSESLKNTLSCYQLSSADSLSGPSGYPALAAQLWFKENSTNTTPPTPRPPVIQIPLLMPNDTSTKRSETYLSGVKISCFIVGGEKRLCLPQILTTVLKDYSIQEINRTCAELHVYCSRCSPDQLEILKVLGILPFNTTQCGLITKTDAERLVAALGAEFHLNGKHDFNTENSKGIHVYHECFGGGDGIFYPDRYLSPDSTCIACLDCRSTFSPSRFVLHSHSILEKRTCHWGFDRDNWRHYLLIPRNIEETKYLELEKKLDQLKARFDPSADGFIVNQLKRRLKTESGALELSTKRLKGEKDADYSAPAFGVPISLRSAFKPFTATQLPTLAELQANPDSAALMKAFVSVPLVDRTLYPGLVPFVPQIVPPPHTSSEWTRTTHKVQEPPNVSLQPINLQKKPVSSVHLSDKNQDSFQKQSLERDNNRTASKQAHENATVVKTEGAPQSGVYPVSRRRSVEDRDRNAVDQERPFLDPGRSRPHLPPKTDAWKCALHDSAVKRSREQDRAEKIRRNGDPRGMELKRIREEENVALKSAVAAAMLELSSGVEDRNKPAPRVPSHSARDFSLKKTPSIVQNPLKSPNSSYPKIVPFPQSKDHFKWCFLDSTFVISASGTEELKAFQRLLKTFAGDTEVLLKQVVRMKYRYEENLDVQGRAQQNLQMELERLKTSKQRCLDEAADSKTQLRHELDRVRNEHYEDIKEANKALITLGKNHADSRHQSNHDDGDTLQHQILDRLHKQIDGKVDEVRDLEKQLLEERDRRMAAERRLEEMVETDRVGAPRLTNGGLNTIANLTQRNHSSTSTIDSRSPPSGYPSRDDDVTGLSASTSPCEQSPKDSGVHDV